MQDAKEIKEIAATAKSKLLLESDVPLVRIAPSNFGRGVFALKHIPQGEIFDVTPAIRIPDPDARLLDSTVLQSYYYEFFENPEPPPDDAGILGGFGSIYNHSWTPNALFLYDVPNFAMEFVALRDIEEGEEIFTNYNGFIDDFSPWPFAGAPNPLPEISHLVVPVGLGALPIRSPDRSVHAVRDGRWTVRALRACGAGKVLEHAAMLQLSNEDWNTLEPTELYRHRVATKPNGSAYGLSFGVAGFAQRSFVNANLIAIANESDATVNYCATRDIAVGDELFL